MPTPHPAKVMLSYLPPRGEGLWYTRVDRLHTCDLPSCTMTARFDARLPGGPWGYICLTHAKELQVTLGLGRGQLLLLPDEEFVPQPGQ